MAIRYDGDQGIFFLDTDRTTYQMKTGRYGHLLHLYYGRTAKEAMDGNIMLKDRGFSGNPYEAGLDRTYSLDALPQEYPTQGTGDYRSPLLSVTDERGVYGCDLRVDSHRIIPGKYSLPELPAAFASAETDEAQTLEILLVCGDPSLEVTLYYGVLPHADVITRSAVIRNTGTTRVTLEKAQTACLDFTEGDFDRIIFYGRHTMERVPDRQAVGHGATVIGSRRGFSSHQYNPMMILCEQQTDEESGRCWSMQFVYSGGFKAEIEKDQYDQTRMQMGLMEEQFSWPLAPGEEFVLPEVLMSFSDDGLDRLSRNHHECLRRHICRWPSSKGRTEGFRPPVLLNSWEACFFDFDGEKICRMAEEARGLGADMVVLDDGWFGQRIDDLRGLGDWTPNEEKLGCSLGELSGRIHEMGLDFGIWMEPEMVSEDSELYRRHPDRALRIPGRDPVQSRYQLVLDLSRPEVAEAVYEEICAVLDSARIEYLKWDANRHIADLYSQDPSEEGGRVRPSGKILHSYVLGLYRILEQLRDRYPGLLIEGCCGGGGRFDAGMLYYTPQIWCSDNTDPIDRLLIQYGTSFGYPPETMGAHVSASPNAETGRHTPLQTRFVAAMAGTFGYELDPEALEPAEKESIRGQIRVFHRDHSLIRTGRYHRLTDPAADPVGAWMAVSQDQRRAVVSAVSCGTGLPLQEERLLLRGLRENSVYRVEETGEEASGQHWMKKGLPLSFSGQGPWDSIYVHLEML